MPSKACFYHKGLGRNLLLRTWPLWGLWFALLMMVFPLSVNESIHAWRGESMAEMQRYIVSAVLQSGCAAAQMAIFAAIISAMAMFSYLYNARTCGMISALPLRRETVFATAYLTGLLPLLAAELLTALLAWGILKANVSLALIARWLLLAGMSTVAFYGFSVFCAQLTGSLFILPLVYLVLNLTAFVAENCVRELLKVFLYGYAEGSASLAWLSPLVEVARMGESGVVYSPDGITQSAFGRNYSLPGEKMLAAYCAAGIVFSILALLLYRRRRMETAGDTVAIPLIKPVFKYCMAFGTAVVLAGFITGEFFDGSFRTSGRALVALFLLLAGGFIGYYAAEMLIQKTMNVFRTSWKGLLAVWSVLALFVIICEFDLTGYETRLPDSAEVEAVNFGVYGASELKDQENIASALALHEHILRSRENETDPFYRRELNLHYTLKNGRELSRCYNLSADAAHLQDEASAVWQAQELANVPEAILSRKTGNVPVLPDTVSSCRIYVQLPPEGKNSVYGQKELVLSAQEAYTLYTEAIAPDMEDGLIGRSYFIDEAAQHTLSDTTISFDLSMEDDARQAGFGAGRIYFYQYFDVELDSERTVAWLKKNLELEVKPSPVQKDAEPLAAPAAGS